MKPDDLAAQIVREASRFVGLREVRRNSDWDNPRTPERDFALAEELRALMRPSPWEEGWAYCAAYAEGVVVAALQARFGLSTAADECVVLGRLPSARFQKARMRERRA